METKGFFQFDIRLWRIYKDGPRVEKNKTFIMAVDP